ncbi:MULTISPECIES: YheC/YheD family protein [Paenibacillus]|uniref:YheC/YheD family protein n=1 Tax=Paenibacillus TaxID=44249 RepID=UPI0022B8E62E|nr:YheC/YheD family protein [Paenibacillus caseinilyticus]MCZ8521965.1 YheC/YheD family protein [Paenibacillus caseinilyticus]
MIRKRQWHVRSKWIRHLGLIGQRRLRRHIPPTSLLSRKTLNTYMKRYRVLYIKPVFGSFGNHIMKLSRSPRARGRYVVRREQRVQVITGRQVPGVVMRHARSRAFLIQRGIPLLHIGGHPVDYRLMMLRPGREWQFMGIMGKVASGARIVTNYNHGGKAIRFRESLRRAGFTPRQIDRVFAEMRRVGYLAARQFGSRHKHCRRLGIDFAIDTNKRIWIIEVNTNPFYELFRHHENRTLYRRIHGVMQRISRLQSNR